jgi:hypothetical protein
MSLMRDLLSCSLLGRLHHFFSALRFFFFLRLLSALFSSALTGLQAFWSAGPPISVYPPRATLILKLDSVDWQLQSR